jgi:O-antigen ligase
MIARRLCGNAFSNWGAPPAAALAAAGFLFAAAAYAARSSDSVGLLLALGIALSPLLLAIAWSHPLIFPYGAYAVLVPFDLLLATPALGTAARLCGALAGAALLLRLIRGRKVVVPGPPLGAWIGFVLWSAISTLWAMNPTGAWRETGTLVQLASLYAIASLVPATSSEVRAVFGAVVLGGLAAALLGIRELVHPSVAQQLINEASDRIPLLIGNHRLDINQFADALLLPLALVTVATVRARNVAYKLGGLAAIGVLLYAMSLAASREAFIAVALMFGYFLVVLSERVQLVALAGGLTALALANGNLLHRFLSASASGGSGRLSIWGAGLGAFRQHWLTGAGSGSFAAAYDRVYLKIFQPYDMGWSRAAHNMLIQNGVEYGIVGIGLLILGVLLTLHSLPRLRKEHPLFGMRASIVGALFGLCVAGFFVDLTTAKVFWLALTLAALVRAGVAAAEPHVRAMAAS